MPKSCFDPTFYDLPYFVDSFSEELSIIGLSGNTPYPNDPIELVSGIFRKIEPEPSAVAYSHFGYRFTLVVWSKFNFIHIGMHGREPRVSGSGKRPRLHFGRSASYLGRLDPETRTWRRRSEVGLMLA